MSDDDRDMDNMDMESEDDDMEEDDMNDKMPGSSSSKPMTQAEKRAHHNALERKRRDHIKDSFSSLRDAVPSLNGEKQSSRAQILKKAADYIQYMRRKNSSHQHDIEDLKRQNHILENQIRSLERARISGNVRAVAALGDTKMDLQSIKLEADEHIDEIVGVEEKEYQVVTSSSDSSSTLSSASTSSIPKASGVKKTKVAIVTSSK